MYCTQCGCKIEDEFKFCPECGSALEDVNSPMNDSRSKLIKCPDCGKEISEKAEGCPNCGCPSSEFWRGNKTNFQKIVEDVCRQYYPEKEWIHKKNVAANKELRRRTGIDMHEAANAIYMEKWGYTYDDARRDQKERLRIKKQQDKAQMQDNLQKIAAMGNMISGRNKTVCCPKCGSTSISYGNKKLSIGRSAVGYGVAGPTGAILGGLSSKKGYAVCLNCGKQWKI